MNHNFVFFFKLFFCFENFSARDQELYERRKKRIQESEKNNKKTKKVDRNNKPQPSRSKRERKKKIKWIKKKWNDICAFFFIIILTPPSEFNFVCMSSNVSMDNIYIICICCFHWSLFSLKQNRCWFCWHFVATPRNKLLQFYYRNSSLICAAVLSSFSQPLSEWTD